MSSSCSYLSLCVFGIVILWLSVGTSAQGTPVEVSATGFSTVDHGVASGKITVLNAKQIQIEAMKYDGDVSGPGAWFAVGSKVDAAGKPDFTDIKLLPDENGGCTPLKAYDGTTIPMITLTLPDTVKIEETKFLAVYSVTTSANYGLIEFPATAIDPTTLPAVPVTVTTVDVCPPPTNATSTTPSGPTTPSDPTDTTDSNAPNMSFFGSWKGSWLLLLFIAVPCLYSLDGN